MTMVPADQAAAQLAALRRARPLVHNITNAVAMDISANALLALGASPAMVSAAEEVEDFAEHADALVVNIGTLTPPSVTAMRLAAGAMQRQGKPWVLDPVGCGATPFRTASAAGLVSLGPTCIRGNASEIASLAGAAGVSSRGVDTTLSPEQALADAKRLAAGSGAIVAMTGPVDYVTDGETTIVVEGGHPLMPLVTGLGCALSASVAGFLGASDKPLAAVAGAMATFAIAGSIAAQGADGPGSFRVRFIDALHRLQPADVVAQARLRAE